MDGSTRFVGFDTSKASIAVAIADSGREPARYWGTIPNTPEAVRQLLAQLGSAGSLQVCYEAGPTGYGLYRPLIAAGIAGTVVAPALMPRRPGDRVKTDRRDALRLAELFRAGELPAVWVPTAEDEALRDLVRAREDAVADRLRARHHLSKFLLRREVHPPAGVRAWSVAHRRWLDALPWTGPRGVVFREVPAYAGRDHGADPTARAGDYGRGGDQSPGSRDSGPPSLARGETGDRRHRGVGGGLLRPLSARRAGHGVCGAGAPRVFQRGPPMARRDHEDRECPSAAGGGGSGLGVSPSGGPHSDVAGATSRAKSGGSSHRVAGSGAAPPEMGAAHSPRQRRRRRHGGGRAGASGVHVGGGEGGGRRSGREGHLGRLNPIWFDPLVRGQGPACPENPRACYVRGSGPMHVPSLRQLRTVT